MCLARKSGPGREQAIAVDWRDCAWSPRIVVQFPAPPPRGPVIRVGRRCRAAQTSTRTSAAVFLPVRFSAGDQTITRRNRIYF